MKKVLFVAHVVRLHFNRFHLPYVKWFHEQGWQVDVAAHNDYNNPEDCIIPYCDNYYNIPFERNPLRKENISAYKQLKKIIQKNEYDIIHCHTPVGGVLTRLAASKYRNIGKTKVIYTAHGFHFYKGASIINWLVYYPIERAMARKTDVLITMNKEDFLRAQKFRAKNIECINGIGIDLSRYIPIGDEEKRKIRTRLGLKDDEYFGITVGNLIKRKNQKTLIRAVSKLNNSKFHLFLCGDGECLEELNNEAIKLGIEKQIHFLGFCNNINRLCGAADVFLFSSIQEGMPVAVMEAMAVGLPVIATNIRGNDELIVDGKGGYLVNVGDVDTFAKYIGLIISCPKMCEKMRRFNIIKVKEYGIDVVNRQMADIYMRNM